MRIASCKGCSQPGPARRAGRRAIFVTQRLSEFALANPEILNPASLPRRGVAPVPGVLWRAVARRRFAFLFERLPPRSSRCVTRQMELEFHSMAIIRANRGSDAALGLALVTGLVSFCVTTVFCWWLALSANLIQLHLFERRPRISALERASEALCVIFPVIVSSILAHSIYDRFRRRRLGF